MTFDEEPDYDKCRRILRNGLKKRGHKDDGKLVFLSATPKAKKPTVRTVRTKNSSGEGSKKRSIEEKINVRPKRVKVKSSSTDDEIMTPNMIEQLNKMKARKKK